MGTSHNRLQRIFNGKIPTITYPTEPVNELYAHNCENVLGVVHVPVGAAGPLVVAGQHAAGLYTLPLATTEACLVASVHRGAKIMAQAGGATTTVRSVGISRAPVFAVNEVRPVEEYNAIVADLFEEMQQSLATISRHTELHRYEVAVRENYVYVRFWFHTGEAMGMNMATIAAKYLADTFLEKAFGGRLVATSSNWCTDKKPSHDNATLGRKFSVRAQVTLQESVLAPYGVDATSLLEVYHAKIQGGSALAGALGHNAHHANIIAGVYAATGQDLAHTVEGSHGKTTMRQTQTGLEVAVDLPAVLCGVLGGGTKLPLQSQYLQVIGLKQECGSGAQSMEFAEVIGAGVLAGELSLLIAIAQKRLASAHDQFRKETPNVVKKA